MMYQHKSIILSGLLCLAAMLAVVGVLFVMDSDELPVNAPALSCDQLTVSVTFSGETQSIRVWKSSDGVLYFFIPAGSDDQEMTFSNLGAESTLQLDSVIYTPDHAVIKELEYAKPYMMSFCPSSEPAQTETAQMVFLKSGNVSSLFIDTDSGSMEAIHSDKEVKETASMTLIRPDGNIEYAGKLQYIRSRGNSSFFMEKKSYQIKLLKSSGLLDMPSAEKWILLADFIDDSLIKNEVIFQFAERCTTVPSIQGKFVDLYLNGDYVGNYYLCEKIEVGTNRLDITDLLEKTQQVNYQKSFEEAVLYISEDGRIKASEGLNNPADITGGYLLEYIPLEEYESASNAFMTERGSCYEIVSPNPATVEQAEYICNQFNELEIALAEEDGVNPATGRHFSEYLDVESWISKYLMDEVFHNVDASGHSMFFYKDSDDVDPHIFSGPMWDYDKAFGSSGNAYYYRDDSNRLGNFGIYVREMFSHDEIRQQIYDTFQDVYQPYVRYQVSTDVYQVSRLIQPSAEMNRIRWPQVNGYYSDPQAGIDYIIDFLKRKTEHLTEVWLQDEMYCTVTFLDYNGNVYNRYFVKRGDYLDDLPEISSYEGIFSGWYTAEGVKLDLRLPVLQDEVYRSEWIGLDVLLTNGLIMSEMDISMVDPEMLRQWADMIEAQRNEIPDSNDME